MRWLMALAMLAILALPSGIGRANRAPSGLPRATVTDHGVQLSLTLPGRVYPRDALIRVGVELQNVSDHTVGIWTEGNIGPPEGTSPDVEVLTEVGRMVYPPAIQGCCAYPGVPPYPVPFKAGQAKRFHTFVILRGTRLRATVTMSDAPKFFGPQHVITTPPLSVRLTPPDRPAATLQEGRANPPRPLAVTFTPRGRVKGRLLYVQWMDCYYFDVNVGIRRDGTIAWTSGSDMLTSVQPDGAGTQLVPRCQSVQEVSPNKTLTGSILQWHIVAGWPNHSVRVYDFPSGWIDPATFKP